MSVTTWIKKLQGDHSVIRRALRFIEEGDLDSAERALVEGNESFPDNWMIKYHLAYCLVLKRDFERAVAALKDGGLRYVNAETLDNVFGWCNSMEVAKEYVPAITLYNLIGEMFPGEDAAKAYFHAARVHRFANQTHKMIESFVRSTEHGDYPEFTYGRSTLVKSCYSGHLPAKFRL